MPPTAFQMEVPDFLADDYESFDTVRGDIERESGKPMPEEELASAILSLSDQAVVDVYNFLTQSFRKKYLSHAPQSW